MLPGITPIVASLLSGANSGPAMQPDEITNKQNLGFQWDNDFVVGRGNDLTSTPQFTASPVDSTNTAPSVGGPASLDKNTLILIGAAVVALLILIFGARRR